MWRGSLSLRKATVLARNLPAGAGTWESCGYDSAWSAEAHLTASVFDALQIANWQRADKAPRPQPLTRPGDAHRASVKGAAIEAKAKAFAARQAATTDTTDQGRPRDGKGRFTKKEG